jgi:adenylate cyclase class IV
MSIETEVKIRVNPERKIDEIYKLMGKPVWQTQNNYLFSFNGNFLRLRYEAGKAFLTVKGAPLMGKYHGREEVECEIPVEFFSGFSRIHRGYSDPVHYTKLRASTKLMNCQICLDKFYGNYYLEIEGKEKHIKKVIKIWSLENLPVEKKSYLELLGY